MLQDHVSLQSYPTQPEDLPAGQNSPDDDEEVEAAGASKGSEGDDPSGNESETASRSSSRRQAQEVASVAVSGDESDKEPLKVRAQRRRCEVGSPAEGDSGPAAVPAPAPEKTSTNPGVQPSLVTALSSEKVLLPASTPTASSTPMSPPAATSPGTSSLALAPRKAALMRMRPVYSFAKAPCRR